MNSILETEALQLHAEICAGLADPNRILILYELSQSRRNVTELSTNLKMPQPLVSLSPESSARAWHGRVGAPRHRD